MTTLAKVQARQGIARLRKGNQRLHTRADFERVRREGRSWSHRLLVLVACPNTLGGTRVGIAAGKRVGSAIARNRAKRLIREAMRQFYPRIRAGWDLILIARVAIVLVKMQAVAVALESLLRRAELLPGPDDQAGSSFRQHTE